MENEKMKNNDDLNLYDVFKENYDIGRRRETVNERTELLNTELFFYGHDYLFYQSDFVEVESILGLRKNLEFFFSKFLPFLIYEVLRKKQTKINSLDASELAIFSKFELHFLTKENKTIFYCDNHSEYFLPSNHDYSNFDELLTTFIIEYHLGQVVENCNHPQGKIYYIAIDTTLKNLIYACYIGQEWVKSIGDDCINILSDYYNEEQLASFKKTLHR